MGGIGIPELQEQLNGIKNLENFRFYDKFDICGCFITSVETDRNKAICELSYDYVVPKENEFINLMNEIKEKPKEKRKRFKLIKELLRKRNEKNN